MMIVKAKIVKSSIIQKKVGVLGPIKCRMMIVKAKIVKSSIIQKKVGVHGPTNLSADQRDIEHREEECHHI